MTGLLAFDADVHLGAVAPLAISKGVRIFLPYYKLFNAADRDAIFAAGAAVGVPVGIIPIFETTAERALQGGMAGIVDGHAIAQYMKNLNQPAGTSYVLTFDFDEQTAQDDACKAYAVNCVSTVNSDMGAIYPMVAYGNGAFAETLKSLTIARFAWDAGGMGMRGTRADIAAGAEDMQQDVGDVRGLNLGIDLDSDFAPHANSPADLCAWMAAPAPAVPVIPPAPTPSPTDWVATILEASSFTVAVEAFQRANGLDVDGVIGPITLRKLWGK